MKKAKTKQRFSLSAVVLAAALMVSGFASCSKSETEPSPDGSRAISLSANVQGTTQTRASVDGTSFPASINNVFRLTTYSGTAAPSNWTVPYFNDIQVNSGTSSALTLVTKQYYPANGNKVYFYGYAPSATSLTAGTTSAPIANYTITGQEDIMAAQVITGISAVTTGTQPQPTLAFTHKLMQLKFKIVKDASFEANKKVTEILVKGVKTSAKLNISTGALSFDATPTGNLSLPNGTKDEITSGGTEMDGCIMLEPIGTGGTITLKVIADGVTYDNISVTLTGTNNGKAGTSHLITLTFKRTGITPTAIITDWAGPVDKDIDIDGGGWRLPVVGDFINGGIVYWVDGANYKVVSLEVPKATAFVWSGKNDFVVTDARSDADGRANSKAIKDYFEANKAIVGSDFAVAFPAAAACYNYTGKDYTDPRGSWYLPAKSELQYLWCAFNGMAPISWESGTNTSVPADPTAQTVFNTYLTDAGGVAISNVPFWSSTEYRSNTSYAWCVDFSNGNTGTGAKNYNGYVRCVKHIALPPVVGDYYYSDGSYSAALDAKKTATGVIYYIDPADPTKFKVVSLEEASTTLGWAKAATYVVNGAQHDADGRANSKAIRDYFGANTATVGSDFAVAFPAAAYCYNYKGKAGTDALGSWYLPSKFELQYLWCAYNGVTPISWTSGANASAPTDAVKQTLWNDRIKAAGIAAGISSGYFWSSTELSYGTGSAWCVDFSNGDTSYSGKGNGYYYVRCVRDI